MRRCGDAHVFDGPLSRERVLEGWPPKKCQSPHRRTFAVSHRHGEPLQRAAIRRRFLTACKVLGLARLRTVTIHHGRHTFISHALAGERTLVEVRTAAGHTNIAVTSIYLHIAVDDDGEVGDLFEAR